MSLRQGPKSGTLFDQRKTTLANRPGWLSTNGCAAVHLDNAHRTHGPHRSLVLTVCWADFGHPCRKIRDRHDTVVLVTVNRRDAVRLMHIRKQNVSSDFLRQSGHRRNPRNGNWGHPPMILSLVETGDTQRETGDTHPHRDRSKSQPTRRDLT